LRAGNGRTPQLAILACILQGALEIKTGEDHARVVIHNPCCKVGGLFVLFDGEVRENQVCNVGALSNSSS